MRAALPLVLVGVILAYSSAGAVPDGSGGPSPHDGQHLVVIRPADFTAATGAKLSPARDKGAAFDGTAIPLSDAVSSPVQVRHSGRYTLWVRIGVTSGTRARMTVTLSAGDKPMLRATAGDDRGADGRGGPIGYEVYRKQASKSGTFKDVVIDPDGKKDDPRRDASRDAADFEKELTSGGKPATDWIHPTRLEQPLDARPFYWWKVGTVELTAGAHRLRVEPATKIKPDAALLDGAFLTTFDKLAYPYVGDLNATKSSYIRFRIDRLPKTGVHISAGLRIHTEPWSTPRVWLNPARINTVKAEPHTRNGYTRWYRLQDIDRAPAFGAAQAHLHLAVAPLGKADVAAAGATQFAVFPHQDYVLREIDWSEPEGLNVSLTTDFETYLHQLRTLRDHAREHYEKALTATGDKLFPLTRGDLYFGNAWGAASGECADYMNMTLRLLGFNSVGASFEPIKYRELYGWTSSAGHYWPPAFLPYDAAESQRQYDEHYRAYFSKQTEFYKGVTTFQIADEPAEISRSEMTSPLWRYLKDNHGEKWADVAGNSDLHTRRVDLHDCVLEGKVEKLGNWIGFRVGLDDPVQPKRYAFWHIGLISVNREMNLSAGQLGRKGPANVVLNRPGAVVARTPTAFKIIYQGNSAALFLNGKLIHQHTDLPARGGFGFTGAAKAIRELRLRPMRKEERLAIAQPEGAPEKNKSPLDDLVDDLKPGDKNEPEWARPKPLEKALPEDWVVAGGMATAHEAFRKWAADQGLQPTAFGQKSWNEVRMLTVAELVRNPEEARLFYWSRRFSGYLTPRMFNLSAEAIHKHAPNPAMRGFVALSGHSLYFPSSQPLDMFQLAAGPAMMPGISDWMSLGSWFWDSHQAVAYSMAPYNAGARRYGQEPLNYPMMHCVGPSTYRSYTMLANQARYISFYNFGPSYAVTEGHWSENDGCYDAVQRTANRAALVDDVLAKATVRPSRVAMLYSMANEYWNPQSSFADKRASFLALAHEYYQPELVTEDQVNAGALKHYDALYVLDPIVTAATQTRIEKWVQGGGLLWACADALSRNEYNEDHDLLKRAAGLTRTFAAPGDQPASTPTVAPVSGQADFRPHSVVIVGKPRSLGAEKGRIRARYDDGSSAWLEVESGKGRIVYVAHRVGLTYTSKKVRPAGYHTVWADTGRALLSRPLHDATIERELVLSDPVVMVAPLSSADGTVVVLYNMQPTPRTNLHIGLKEPQRPHSVEAFTGPSLKPLPFEYRDGRVWLTLSELTAEQMILVRRKPAPPDDRLAEMRQRTERQLQAADAATLAAGAWFAGFHPDWKLADRLLPLLTHERWEVRRAAAESLGRIGDPAPAERIRDVLRKETDAHVLGDEMIALARLGHPQVESIARELLTHKNAWLRRQAVQAVTLWMNQGIEKRKPTATVVLETAWRDPDLRVRQVAIEWLARVDPSRAVSSAASVFADPGSTPHDRSAWVQAVADQDAAFREYVQQGLPGGNNLLLAIASRRADPALAAALITRSDPMNTGDAPGLVTAALRQRHGALTRKLFEQRDRMPPVVAAHLPLILEHTFEKRLGNVLPDWEAFLKQ